MPPFADHEALVCAAFFTACNAGAITGCSLEELVTRFVSELIIPRGANYPLIDPVDKIKWKGEFKAKFIFPFDTQLPSQVHETLGTTQSSRPDNRFSVDAVVLKSDMMSYDVMVEAKSTSDLKYVRRTIIKALNCQDTNAKVSFIVVDKKFQFKIPLNLESIMVLNRSEVVDQQWKEEGPLTARIFYVTVQKRKGPPKVILEPLDGRRMDEMEDRLIFVISRDEIESIFE
jgi:hypothetical protein